MLMRLIGEEVYNLLSFWSDSFLIIIIFETASELSLFLLLAAGKLGETGWED